MDKANLKRTRLLAPGVIFLICVLPFLKLSELRNVASQLPDGVSLLLLTFICLGIGVIYYTLDIRDLLWRKVVQACHKNIRANIFSPFRAESNLQVVVDHITNQEIMGIFYNLLDNDESLKDKQNDVRLNGVILTTVIDLILILIPFSLIYFVAFIATKYPIFLVTTLLSLLFLPLLYFFKAKLVARHLNYENEQIGVINQLYSGRVRSMIEGHKR